MPFILIKGTFHLVNRTSTGKETGFEPDGDSIQFKPDNPALLDQLTQIQQPYRLTKIGSTQLRIEGIDALELHYKPTHGGPFSNQPRPLADDSRDFLTGALSLNPVPYTPPKNIRVKPPVPHDATTGFILARSLEVHGRPVAFVFASDHPAADGSVIELKTSLLRRSFNYQSVLNGFAYPLFYDTLFADLRNALADAAQNARTAKRGIWKSDKSKKGLAVTDQAGLEATAVVFPKLFRRLTDFLAETTGDMSSFLAWLAAKNEQIVDLDTMNFTHFDNILTVKRNVVKMKKVPDRYVFVSAK